MAGSVFGVRARGSTVGRELRGGLVTFVTMAYIVVLNPLILGSFNAADPAAKRDVLGAVLPVAQVAAVTALVAGVDDAAVRGDRQLPLRDRHRAGHQHPGRGHHRAAGQLA